MSTCKFTRSDRGYKFLPSGNDYDVIDPLYGPTGTLRRIPRTAPSGAQRSEWQPLTPTDEPGPVIDSRYYAALWLRYRIAPELLVVPVKPDPVLAIIRRFINDAEPHQAAAAALTAIAEDIDQMRSHRAHHNPPALWHHLDRFATWLTELAGEPAAAAEPLPRRLGHLRAVI